MDGTGADDIFLAGINNDFSPADCPQSGFIARFAGTNIWGEAPSHIHENNYSLGSHLYYQLIHPVYGMSAQGSSPFAIDTNNDAVKDALVFCGGEGLRLLNPSTGDTIWTVGPNTFSSADVVHAGQSNSYLVAGGTLLGDCLGTARPGLVEAVTFAGQSRWQFILDDQRHGPANGITSIKAVNLASDGTTQIAALLQGRILLLDETGQEVDFLDAGCQSMQFLPNGAGHDLLTTSSNRLIRYSWTPTGGFSTNWFVDLPAQIRSMVVRDLGLNQGTNILLALDANRVEMRDPQDGHLQRAFPINSGRANCVEAADLDGDGEKEIIVGSFEGKGMLYAFDLNGRRLWAQKVGYEFYRTSDYSCPRFADLDGDGTNEMCVVTFYSNVTEYYRNRGLEGDQILWQLVDDHLGGITTGTNGVGNLAQLAFADLDADGKPELYIGSESNGISCFTNSGTPANPAFRPAQMNYAGLTTSDLSPVFGDMDGNGTLDLIVGKAVGTLTYVPNLGTPAATVLGRTGR